MCGICGKVLFDGAGKIEEGLLRNMMDVMAHRGPDDEGFYISGPAGLGHRRLAIIDLYTGRQPISNENNTVWVVFNGEIYNYRELREELLQKGHNFRTKTDTEVIIHSYEEYGEDFVSHLRGMFAIAIWDEGDRTLMLVRDRLGIKPLYYYAGNNSFIFASEMKAILQDPSVRTEINVPVIDRFLTYFYTPGPETLIKGIYKLEPGYSLTLKEGKVFLKQYWDLLFPDQTTRQTFTESKAELLDLLQETTRLHMISDVPVGILLSGGVDSTALLNLSMKARNELSTFTIGFEGEDFADERVYARLVAEKFGTKHYETTIEAEDFINYLPNYVWHMEEPVCEPPAIALYYISRLAKDHVKVLISGEGGDEAFAGYQNYRNFLWLEYLKSNSGPFNGIVGSFFDIIGDFSPFRKFKKYAPLMTLPLDSYYYSRTATPFTFFNREFKNLYLAEVRDDIEEKFSKRPTDACFEKITSKDNLSKMLYVDTKTWLPDDLLVKADKITMANSIELRVPLLDHKVLEFAASLPANFKIRGFITKYILKKAFQDKVPEEVIKRKKTGFPVPYRRWFRNELKTYIAEILLDRKTLDRGYFKRGVIEKILSDDSRYSDYSKEIFSLLALELWHRIFYDKESLWKPAN